MSATPLDAAPGGSSLVRRLSWSVLGGVVAAGLLYACNVAAGRFIGPAEYGHLAFAVTLAQVLTIAVSSGMDLASSRAIARAADDAGRAAVVASALAVVTVLAGGIVLVAWAASAPLADALGVPDVIVRAGSVLAAMYAVKAVADRQLAALGLVRFQAMAKPVEAFVTAALLVTVVVVLGHDRAVPALACFGVGTAVLVGTYVVRLRRMLVRRNVQREVMAQLARYGRVAVASAIVPLPLLYGDRVLVQRALTEAEAGVYMAYATSSFLVVAQVLMLVNNVFFPHVAAHDDVPLLVRALRVRTAAAVAPIGLGIAGFLALMLLVFGTGYELDGVLLVGFAAWSALHFCNGLFVTVAMAHSLACYRRYVQLTAVRSAAFLAWLVWLSRSGEVTAHALVIGLVVAELAEVFVVQSIAQRVLGGGTADPTGEPAAGVHDPAYELGAS